MTFLATFLANVPIAFGEQLVPYHGRRRPVAVAFVPGENQALVANQASGTVAAVDLENLKMISESKVAPSIADLEPLGAKPLWFVSNPTEHRLLVLEWANNADGKSDDAVVVRQSIATVEYPTAIRVAADLERLATIGRWSRRLAIHRIDRKNRLEPGRPIDLPFVPGDLAWIQGRLVVTAAFEPKLAIVDPAMGVVDTTILADHRLSRLARSPDGQRIWISAMRLSPLARSNRNDVHWGLMVSNRVGILETRRLAQLSPHDTFDDYRLLGDTGNGKGDPGAIAFNDHYAVVALEGVNQIAVASSEVDAWAFLDVGARPMDVAVRGDTAVVANMLDDSVSVVRLDTLQTVRTLPLSEPRDPTIVELGERLFFDARQSHDGWMSCHSCHVDGHTNHLLNDNFSDSSFGTPKLVISLLGHAATAPFAWDGSRPNLEIQIRNSLETTMQSDQPPTDRTVAALVAFVNQLADPPISVAQDGLRDDQTAGAQLFRDLDCNQCHVPPNYTSSDVYDVGLSDEKGNQLFNPPSLIAVGWKSRFFHDGRAKSLEEVVDKFQHHLKRPLSSSESRQLISFLKSL